MATGSTGAPGNIPYPVGSDQYALTSDLAGMASQINLGLANAGGPDDARPPLAHTHAVTETTGLQAELDAARFTRPWLTTGDDINTVTDTAVRQIVSRSVVNLPGPVLGTLYSTGGSYPVHMVITWDERPRIYIRRFFGGTWGPWAQQSWHLPDITTATDLNTLVTEFGGRAIKAGGCPNAPEGMQGWLETMPLGPFRVQKFTSYSTPVRMFVRRHTSVFTAWDEQPNAKALTDNLNAAKAYTDDQVEGIVGGTGFARLGTVQAAAEREDIVRRGKGGVIGTAGRGVIAFDFDHNLDPFLSTVWPLFRERGIPGSFQVLSDSIENPAAPVEPTTATWAQLRTEHYRGLELWAHSATHSDPAPGSTMQYEIVSPRDAITSRGMRCMGFSVPGAPATYGGSLNTPEKISDSEAGRMIREHYGLYRAYMLGAGTRVLPTNGCRGLGQRSIDSMTAAEVIALIDQAATYGLGQLFMMHPNAIGQPGRLSAAGLAEVLDHVVQLRDAGDLVVLTSGGLAFADPATDRRFDLNPDGVARNIVAYPVRTMGLDGHTAEVTGTVTGAATVQVLSNDQVQATHTVAGSGTRAVHVPILLAGRDANTVTINLTGDWSNLHVRPV